MSKDTSAGAVRCAGPGCSSQIARSPTGRPARYCSERCKKAAQRARYQEQQDAVEREVRLRVAGADAARLWRSMGELGFGGVADRAADVFDAATDTSRPPADLDVAIALLQQAAGELADLARAYRDASEAADSKPRRIKAVPDALGI